MAEAYFDVAQQTYGIVESTLQGAQQYSDLAQGSLDTFIATAENLIDISSYAYNLSYAAGDHNGYSAPSSVIEPDFTGDTPTPITLTPVDEPTAITLATTPTVTTTPGITPGAPTLAFTLPDEFAGLTLPTFSSTIPTIDVDALVAAYSYTEPTYVDQLKEEVKAALEAVLIGGLVVPTTIWDGIWDRAASTATAEMVDAEWAASNYAASMGMTGMPSETLLARLDAATQQKEEALSAVRLEAATQEAQQRREDLWTSITQAIAFEKIWVDQSEGIAGRALASAAKAHEALVMVHNVNLERYNLMVQGAAQSVAIGRLELDRALTDLDVYRVELDRKRLQLESQDLTLREWLAEWDNWKSEKLTELAIVTEEVKVFLAGEGAKARKHETDIATQRLRIANQDQEISNFIAQTQEVAETARAASSLLSARVAKYNGQVGGEGVKQQYDRTGAELAIRDAAGTLEAIDKQITTQIQLVLGTLKEVVDQQVGLASAHLSATHASVSMGGSVSLGDSYGVSISGQCADPKSC